MEDDEIGDSEILDSETMGIVVWNGGAEGGGSRVGNLTSRDSLRERGASSAERGKVFVTGISLAGDKSNGVGIRFGLFDGVEGLMMTGIIGSSQTSCLRVSFFGVWVNDESLSSVDLANSASRDACRASNCAPG